MLPRVPVEYPATPLSADRVARSMQRAPRETTPRAPVEYQSSTRRVPHERPYRPFIPLRTPLKYPLLPLAYPETPSRTQYALARHTSAPRHHPPKFHLYPASTPPEPHQHPAACLSTTESIA